MLFFTELEHKMLCVWKHTQTHTHTHTILIAKAILRKKNGTGGINLPDFRPCLQSYRHKKNGTGKKTEIQINGTN